MLEVVGGAWSVDAARSAALRAPGLRITRRGEA
jgi:hypothetical protein